MCHNCGGVFRPSEFHLDSEQEKSRYEKHNNLIEDIGYQRFVSSITKKVLKDFDTSSIGLDFGAGTGPVISKMLEDRGYEIFQYDPYFHNYPELLDMSYDYIVACEVIEHFYDPKKEFELLHSTLKPNGKLYCKTHIYSLDVDFDSWYYKDDITHVFIYQKQTLEYIQREFGFQSVEIDGRVAVFKKTT
ncbi:MAG: class I SAM-dependent methyltransferase [Campylobacterales bacterium]